MKSVVVRVWWDFWGGKNLITGIQMIIKQWTMPQIWHSLFFVAGG